MEKTVPIAETDCKDRQVDLIMPTKFQLMSIVKVNFYVLDYFIKALELLKTMIIFMVFYVSLNDKLSRLTL